MRGQKGSPRTSAELGVPRHAARIREKYQDLYEESRETTSDAGGGVLGGEPRLKTNLKQGAEFVSVHGHCHRKGGATTWLLPGLAVGFCKYNHVSMLVCL